jgi:hypothetical protein
MEKCNIHLTKMLDTHDKCNIHLTEMLDTHGKMQHISDKNVKYIWQHVRYI